MLRPLVADLHLHTVLSPCADYRMVPELILERAAQMGIGLLAVTDHNSGENAAAVVDAAGGTGISVLPGMEVESREGVHILTLFDDVESLGRWQETVYRALPPRDNVEDVFGAQAVVDRYGQLIRVNKRLLIAAVDLSLEDVVGLSQERGGLPIPAHVDRPANGLLGVLGLLPADLKLYAVEVSARLSQSELLSLTAHLNGLPLVRSSDAHTLEDVGKATTTFLVDMPSIGELALALQAKQGRRIVETRP